MLHLFRRCEYQQFATVVLTLILMQHSLMFTCYTRLKIAMPQNLMHPFTKIFTAKV